jgi:manganese-dependent inorganic pyrophosphatase
MSVFVFGHRNPDTDAICSAIAYADLLRRTTRPDAVAACCGAPNKRTEYVLERAGIAAPRIIMDVRPSAEDLCRKAVVTASFGESFHEVYRRMQAHDLRAIPVVDADRRVEGVLSLLDVMSLFFDNDNDPVKSRTVSTCLEKMHDALGGGIQHAVDPEQRDELMVMVGAMSAEGFTERMKKFAAERLVVVCGDRPTIHLPAIEHGVRVLVITGGFTLSSGLVEAQFIDSVVNRNVNTIDGKAPLADARSVVERSSQPVFPVLGDDGRLVGYCFKTDIVNPPKPQLVLVDHNELTQAVAGAEDAEIVEVLDHHRLGGGLKSTQPIRFINEPVGSTCTLVARQYRAAGLVPEPAIALCMASGIISDTLFLRSPTTTDTDREVLTWLRGLCGLDLDRYAREFFEIGSALRTKPPAGVIAEDCKEFVEQGVRFSISQIEETGFDLFWERKDDLRAALEEFADRRGLDFSALLITDVVDQGSLLLLSHESEALDEINYPRLDRGLYELKNVVSRKKQLLPLLAQLITPPSVAKR